MKEQLIKHMRAAPFQPFAIRMSDGKEYAIRHPEHLALTKHFAIFGDPDQDVSVDLYLLHITSIETDLKSIEP